MTVLRRVWAVLDDATLRHPLRTKIAFGGCLGGVADVSAQCVEGCPDGIDPQRAARLATWRSLSTPFVHYWFNFLAQRFPGTSWQDVLRRVLADQICASPIFNLPFYPLMALLEGKPEDAWCRLSTKYVHTLGVNYCFWPFVHLVTFSIVPLRHRVHFANIASMVWTGILSTLNQRQGFGQTTAVNVETGASA
eukprot:gnl/TRDRNA2_/TRDRNA2_41755_c0_seq1.p1 gnl/TRDRNA2_/TRDRNA2_41755_c0~~gnl/TRDRNA2_/TRDRNA2_41755_c0_seq1.p1  ORF type:complete len:193 (+),score=16.43 gnl/TRDRNA2_/TRDRNA2_41755_c0_seq1:181-759(+)